jgi:predicted TIM-barrel fold metal-dependent hydrolase
MSDFLSGARMEIIDSHVHFLDPARFAYPWLEDSEFARIRPRCLPGDIRSTASAVGISGCVHVPDRSLP